MVARSETDKPFPERCLRGLKDNAHLEVADDGLTVWILSKAFEPHWRTREERTKRGKSHHYESSINWEDDASEPLQLLCKDAANAKCGIVSIRLADLEKARQVNPRATTSLSWERDPIKHNQYHGNLLFSGNLPRPLVRELAAVVATHVQDNLLLIKPEDYASELVSRAARIGLLSEPEQQVFWQRIVGRLRAIFRL